jgi:hypothetical protein
VELKMPEASWKMHVVLLYENVYVLGGQMQSSK